MYGCNGWRRLPTGATGDRNAVALIAGDGNDESESGITVT